MVASRPRAVGVLDAARPEQRAPAPNEPSRPPARPAGLWSDRTYVTFLGILTAAYVALYGTFLVRTDFLPFVFDNNEAFASLWHARNLYEYGFAKSYGLTDEVFSPHEAAHPFVHSHQGNIPRVYALVLYVLGARTIESQIVITTFTLGFAAVWLMYHLLSRLTAPLYACVACLFLLTDYLHIAQWQVATYRVWHIFFVFSSLVCVYQFGRGRRKLWGPLMFVNYACLYYYEYVFVAFVSIFGALFTFSLYWRRPRIVLAVGTIQVLGAVTGMSILLLQLIGYMGWDGVLTDMYLTYFARNFAGGDPTLARRISEFYDQNNVIFWQNYIDSKQLRSVSRFFELLFAHVFGHYTPLLTLLAFTLVGGFLLGSLRAPARLLSRLPTFASATAHEVRTAPPSASSRVRAVAIVLLLALPFALLLAAIGRDDAYAGVPSPELAASLLAGKGPQHLTSLFLLVDDAGAALTAIGAVLAGLVLARGATGRWLDLGGLSLGRSVLAAAFLVGLAQAIRSQPVHYDQAYSPIWRDPFAAVAPAWGERAWLILSALLAVAMVTLGTRVVLGRAAGQLLGLVPYLACGLAAYVIVYVLAPGYIFSGYLIRFAPLAVFAFGLIYALAVAVIVAALVRAAALVRGLAQARTTSQSSSVNGHAPAARLGRARSSVDRPAPAWARPAAAGATLAMAGLLAATLAYWAHVNLAYIGFMPPTYLSFIRILSEPPYRGASFISNNYPAHVAYFTGEWAYTDLGIGRGQVRLTERDGFTARQDLNTYLWMADKRENPAYRWPRYYLCLRNPGLDVALARVTGHRLEEQTCDAIPLVKQAAEGTSPILNHRLVAADQGPLKYWAILELDWDYPPYLRPLPGVNRNANRDENLVRLAAETTPEGTRLRVEYDYEQQTQQPEANTQIRLFGLNRAGAMCALRDLAPGETVLLPPGFNGTLRATVTPRSATREGAEAYSNTLTVGAPSDDCPILP